VAAFTESGYFLPSLFVILRRFFLLLKPLLDIKACEFTLLGLKSIHDLFSD
jgi:hypothetical protein